jgi:hypothetical protein
MSPTETKTPPQAAEKDFFTRLADAGEDAVQRLVELPGGQRAVSAFNDLRTKVDDLGKKVRGIDELEVRVTKLEKELAALKKAKSPARSSSQKPSS